MYEAMYGHDRDHFKEDDEGIQGFDERFKWFIQLCFGL
jgi:hypothetical protein